jgi:UDP-N-acetyl-D-galactosamine dehydrogenase
MRPFGRHSTPFSRNTKVIDIIETLSRGGVSVQVHDPMASPVEVKTEYNVALMSLEELRPADPVILAVAHADYFIEG